MTSYTALPSSKSGSVASDSGINRDSLIRIAEQLVTSGSLQRGMFSSGEADSTLSILRTPKDENIYVAAYALGCSKEANSTSSASPDHGHLVKASTFLIIKEVLQDTTCSKTKQALIYLLYVLTSSNSRAQYFAEASGCLYTILAQLSDTLSTVGVSNSPSKPNSRADVDVQATCIQNMCGALCSCVNNPLNRENQQIISASAAFRLMICFVDCQTTTNPIVAIPVLNLVSAVVDKNEYCKKSPHSDVAIKTLVKLLICCGRNMKTKSVADVILPLASALDAYVEDSPANASHAGSCGVVTALLGILSSCCGKSTRGGDSSDDRTLAASSVARVLLLLAHCVELVECNRTSFHSSDGCRTMMILLSKNYNQDVNNAIRFALQAARCNEQQEVMLDLLSDIAFQAADNQATSNGSGQVSKFIRPTEVGAHASTIAVTPTHQHCKLRYCQQSEEKKKQPELVTNHSEAFTDSPLVRLVVRRRLRSTRPIATSTPRRCTRRSETELSSCHHSRDLDAGTTSTDGNFESLLRSKIALSTVGTCAAKAAQSSSVARRKRPPDQQFGSCDCAVIVYTLLDDGVKGEVASVAMIGSDFPTDPEL